MPKFLHRELLKAIGGPVATRPQRLRVFYAATLADIPPTATIAAEPAKFWRTAFAAAFGEGDRRARRMGTPRPAVVGADVWSDVLRVVEQRVDRHTFWTWLRDTTLAHDRGDVLEVVAPSADHVRWIAKHYADVVDAALATIRPGTRVAFVAERPQRRHAR